MRFLASSCRWLSLVKYPRTCFIARHSRWYPFVVFGDASGERRTTIAFRCRQWQGGLPHTPGHIIYCRDNLLIAGDIMYGVALQLKNPECCARYDIDKESAIASRKSVLELVKKEDWTMCGMHFPTVVGVTIK